MVASRVAPITVFGGHGFVGSTFCNEYPGGVFANDRNDLFPETNKILYLISTVDNYNVKTNPHLDIDTNLSLFITVLENCRKRYGNDFEFNLVSSWFTYGRNGEYVCKEDSPCNPTGFYSVTARCREQLLISYCETYGISYRILRLANVMGIGDKKASMKKNAVQYLVGEICKGNDINIYTPGSIRDYIHVRDAAWAIALCLKKGELNSIYNVGNGVECDTSELLKYAHQCVDGKGKLNYIDVPEFHKIVQATDIRLNIDKLFSLGYKPVYTATEIIEELVTHFLSAEMS